jgi:hypothetical protein
MGLAHRDNMKNSLRMKAEWRFFAAGCGQFAL